MPSDAVRTVGIVGLGLIGGSIGLALREPGRHIVGFDPSEIGGKVALDRGCVDRLAPLEEVVKAEIVFIAVPPDLTVDVATQVMALTSDETVVTDCASVKGEVAAWAEAQKHARFVPGHPMAGHEKGGAAYASSWMYQNARWLLTPGKATAAKAVRLVEAVVKAMGARPIRIDSVQHDRQVALASHLPHVLAASIVTLGEEAGVAEIAGGSWKDMTRVGGVDPNLWTQILMGNRHELVRVIEEYEGNLNAMKEALAQDNRTALHAILTRAFEIKARQTAAEAPAPKPRRGKR